MPTTDGPAETYDAIILGAGVLGLTIALELAQKGLKVVIAARDLPEDIHSTAFSSPWAGASFVPWAENALDASREARTYARFRALADTRPDLVAVTKFRYGYNTPGAYPKPISAAHLLDWRDLSPAECPGSFTRGIGFTSLTLNPPAYTLYLLDQLRDLGVGIYRARVSSIYEAFDIPLPPTPASTPSLASSSPFSPSSTCPAHPAHTAYTAHPAHPTDPAHPSHPTRLSSPLVINATGLGSLSLLGLSDPLVHPARGQTITVRAPRVLECLGVKEPRPPTEAGWSTYIIPRPGSGGLVTVGGCYQVNNWNTSVDPIMAERILREAVELCPELEGEDGVDVVSHNVGLRPCRVGGVRVELEYMDLGKVGGGVLPRRTKGERGKVAVVHAYGVGGAGYQDSFGIAEDVAETVLQHRRETARVKGKL